MNNLYIACFLSLCLQFAAFADGPDVYSVPSDQFPDLPSVIEYINTEGPGSHGLTFEIAGGEVFAEPHLVITTTATSTAPIVIAWDGIDVKPIINFTGTPAGDEAGITLEGVSFITIDGLDIRNPDGELEYGILITNADAQTGSHNNIVKNTHITLNKENPNQTNGIRVFANHIQTEFSGTNSHNSFVNNHISNVLLGYVFDSNTGNVDLMDTGNFVGTEEDGEHIVEDIVMCGVYLLNQNGAVVDNVQFLSLNRFDDGTNTAPATISTTGALPSGPLTNPIVISNNTIVNQYSPSTTIFGMYLHQRNVHYEVFNNKLHNIKTDGEGTTYASGIFLFGTGTSADIYNNMVSGIAAPNSPGISVRGIYVRTFNFVNIFYNSVLIDYAASNADNISAALSVHNNNNPVDIRNNIFVNKTTFPPLGNGFATAFLKNNASLTNIENTSDRNIYFAGTPSLQNLIFQGGSTASDQTLAAYKERAETFDQNSFTEDVPFVSSGNLHVNALAETVVRGNAMPVTTPIDVDTDINGKERDPENPDIGAHELPEPFPDLAMNPNPAHEDQNVDVSLQALQWQYISSLDFVNPQGFLVYFGTNENPGQDEFLGWIEFETDTEHYTMQLPEGPLAYETIWYWMVVPSLDEEDGPEAEGPMVWSFTSAEEPKVTLTVLAEGEGVVEVNGTAYTEPLTITEGSDLFLEAIAHEGWEFTGWTGDLVSDNASETISMDSDKTITALFTPLLGVYNPVSSGVLLYPNPVTEQLTVFSDQTIEKVLVYDINGRQVFSKSIQNNRTTMLLSFLDAGVYFVHVHTNTDSRVEKIYILTE